MSIVTGTIRGRATVEASSVPKVYNVPVTLANTEYSQALSTGTKAFTIKLRDIGAKLQIAFVSTESGTTYVTIPSGAGYTADGLDFGGTIYFQSNKPSQVVEILEWA